MIFDEIKEQTNNKYPNLRLREVVLDKQSKGVKYTFAFPVMLNDDDKNEIIAIVKKLTPNSFRPSFAFIRDYVDCDFLVKTTLNLLARDFVSLSHRIKEENIIIEQIDSSYTITLIITPLLLAVMDRGEVVEKIQKYFNSFTHFVVEVSYKVVEENEEEIQAASKMLEQNLDLVKSRILSKPNRVIAVDSVREFIGNEITASPHYIVDLVEPTEASTICGRIKGIKKYPSNKLTVCKFVIADHTSEINCVFFAKASNIGAFSNLVEGDELILAGRAEINSFNNQLEFKAFRIGKCRVLPESDQPKYCKEVAESYTEISPKPYIDPYQQNIFSKKKEIPSYFAKNDIVVFDFETTGFKALQDRIIEIGAVKIHNGEIVETFTSLINPECEVPKEISLLTGITSQMVKGKPEFSSVIGDFYKFCNECTIVGHKIGFDYGFLRYYAKAANYYFGNKQIDTEALARKVFSLPQYISNSPNNYKLATLVQHCEINCNPVHRALGDAEATAKLFIKLYYMAPDFFN